MPEQQLQSQQSAQSLGAYGGGWSVGTVKDISSQAQVHVTLAKQTNILRIHTESAVHIFIDTTSDTANTAANDPILPAGYHDIPIPRGLYKGESNSNVIVIYAHFLQEVSNANKSLRFVES